MAITVSTREIAKDVVETIENRMARVCIVPHIDGTVSVTFERQLSTKVNGERVGAPEAAEAITLSDAEVRAIPEFAIIFRAIADAGDAYAQARIDLIAKQAAAAAEQAAAEAAQDNG